MRKEWFSFLESLVYFAVPELRSLQNRTKILNTCSILCAHYSRFVGMLHQVCTGGETLLKNYSKYRL